MKIAINSIPTLSQLTGIGNCIYSLIKEFNRLRDDIDYTYYYGSLEGFKKELRVYSPDSKVMIDSVKGVARKIPLLPLISKGLNSFMSGLHLGKFDVYFEPNFIPLKIRAKRVVTSVYDFSFHHHPEWHPKDRSAYFKDKFHKGIKRSDAIITNSNFIKDEALSILDFDESQVKVIPLGYDSIFNDAKDAKISIDIPEDYILFVGSLEPRKNLVRLLKAYRQLPAQTRKEYKLLIAGFKGWNNSEIVSLFDEMKDDVKYLGFVDNETLAHLYKNAACFIYPSLYEGFGLPPLEAMACGCPVIVSDVASLPEVCADAAQYIDPLDLDDISDGLNRVLLDAELRQSMSTKGLTNAKRFSWEKSALMYLDVFNEVLNT